MTSFHCTINSDWFSGVGEGGAGGATAPPPPPPPLLDMIAPFLHAVSATYSSYLVSIRAIARLIYIYETTVKQIFASAGCTKFCLRAQKHQKFSVGHAPRGVGNN